MGTALEIKRLEFNNLEPEVKVYFETMRHSMTFLSNFTFPQKYLNKFINYLQQKSESLLMDSLESNDFGDIIEYAINLEDQPIHVSEDLFSEIDLGAYRLIRA
ncbi:MAG: hypothetical protein RL264_1290 [Bacteroidota bacterium]|jgi:hypothetical protein